MRRETLLTVDPHQPALDARVADAAEAWLNDPRDVIAYERLVAAVEHRRRSLDGGDRVSGSYHPAVVGLQALAPAESSDFAESVVPADAVPAGSVAPADSTPAVEPADAVVPADSTDSARAAEPADDAADPEHVDSWPAVRAVGVDLVGDPVAVLRRLRGG